MLPKPEHKRKIYLDHAATTRLDEQVLAAMQPYQMDYYGNPAAIYGIGREANGGLNDARRKVVNLLHALPDNIIFTGGGTESDNLVVYGVAHAHEDKKHIISIPIEHHAILYPLEDLKKQGWDVTLVPVNDEGVVDVKEVMKAIRPDTALITIMYANNEIGSIQPIAELGREILKYRKKNNTAFPYFHTDACQAAGYLDLDVEKLHVDLMTINGSKIYGPKGIGALYIRRGIKVKPMILGGGQESGMRSGTQNVPAIVGLSKALELVQENREQESKRIQELSEYLWKQLQTKVKKIRLNGPEVGDKRLPNNLNVTFMDVEGEALLLYLDEYGIMCSTGSACTSTSLEPSHVLHALGLPYEYAHGSLRFTFGKENTKEDVDYLMKYLPPIVEQLREMSPVRMEEKAHAKFKK